MLRMCHFVAVQHGETFNVTYFSDAVNVVNVKLLIMVAHTDLYIFVPLSIILKTLQSCIFHHFYLLHGHIDQVCCGWSIV